MDNILIYIQRACRKCVRTRRVLDYERITFQVMRKEWDGVDIEDMYCTEKYDKYVEDGVKIWLYYFIELNHFPTIKTLNQYVYKKTFDGLRHLYDCLGCPSFRKIL